MSTSAPETETRETTRKDLLEGWPSEGYDGPQPWNHDELGITAEQRAQVGPGERNTVTPTISHTHPILTSGSADPVVHELGRKLGDLGFQNTVSRGENPFGLVDSSVLSAVESFRQRYGVQEDPSPFGGDTPSGRQQAAAHIGPWTTEAILRAHQNQDDES